MAKAYRFSPSSVASQRRFSDFRGRRRWSRPSLTGVQKGASWVPVRPISARPPVDHHAESKLEGPTNMDKRASSRSLRQPGAFSRTSARRTATVAPGRRDCIDQRRRSACEVDNHFPPTSVAPKLCSTHQKRAGTLVGTRQERPSSPSSAISSLVESSRSLDRSPRGQNGSI